MSDTNTKPSEPQPGTILHVAPGLLSSTAKYLRENAHERDWTTGQCNSMADKLEALARELVRPAANDDATTEKASRIKYQDIAYKAMAFIDKINGDKATRGAGCNVDNFDDKLEAARKYIQELHQEAGMRGILATDAIAAANDDAEIDAMVEEMRDLCLGIDELNRPDGFTEAMEIVNKLAALAKSRKEGAK